MGEFKEVKLVSFRLGQDPQSTYHQGKAVRFSFGMGSGKTVYFTWDRRSLAVLPSMCCGSMCCMTVSANDLALCLTLQCSLSLVPCMHMWAERFHFSVLLLHRRRLSTFSPSWNHDGW